MFDLRYSQPCEIDGTIILREKPMHLGPITDVRGNVWDIKGIFDMKNGLWVQACPRNELHPYYYDTSGTNSWGLVSQTWKPYKVKIYDGCRL